ncbi:TolC family protein [Sandaracinobacter neustonicus]|uniref:TolC family protein n=1 Tax=Sandaracinobacter neustonicus TaxID=1715348 RepID=A0A501XI80_9SPHN|nr:TolC family protein [Sandaracinobacter neustonicus]TPE60185.1 TolC family protein [Sandaracinobacter neustonicus]
MKQGGNLPHRGVLASGGVGPQSRFLTMCGVSVALAVGFAAESAHAAGQAQGPELPSQMIPSGAPGHRILLSEVDRQARDFEQFVKDNVARRGIARPPVLAPMAPGAAGLGWWEAAATTAGPGASAVPLATLVDKASRSSLQINTFGTLPAIRDTAVDEAEGRYAPELFAEGRHAYRNEPTTALSQTAGDPRQKDTEYVAEAGVRTRFRTGAEVTLAQRFSRLDSNIITYNPRRQSRARTSLGLVQPLWRGAGVDYGRAVERVAGNEAEAARDEFRRQAESHLLEVIRAYWVLYLARSNFAQEQRGATEVGALAKRLSGREGVDALPLQISRARAVSATRSAGLVRAENAVRNAEARLKALINDPLITDAGAPAIVPADRPNLERTEVDPQALVETAMRQRPEIRSAFLGYRSALLREGMAQNESMPQLDLVLEGSVNGGGNGEFISAPFNDAYDNRPSYTAGVRFSIPLGPDERDARHKRRRLETVQQALQTRTTVDTVLLELEVSANEMATAQNELSERAEALSLASDDQKVTEERWKAGIGSGGAGADGVFYLDQLLTGQDRLMRAELDFAEAQATVMVARANLSRARGTLLADLGYEIVADEDPASGKANLPRYRLGRAAGK